MKIKRKMKNTNKGEICEEEEKCEEEEEKKNENEKEEYYDN